MKYTLNKHNRSLAMQAVSDAPDGYIMEIKEPTRSLCQNALMWEVLGEISKHVLWDGVKLPSEEWKDLITAVLKKQTIRRGIDGGIVAIGSRTSKMTIKEMNEVIEYAYYFGADNGVKFQAREEAA